jgi:arabinose-5-phosphate isomerase
MIKAAPKVAAQTEKGAGKGASALALARKVLAIESDAVRALADRLDERFLQAVELILRRKGRVLVSGMGKSGHIARKIASTMASTGRRTSCIQPRRAMATSA